MDLTSAGAIQANEIQQAKALYFGISFNINFMILLLFNGEINSVQYNAMTAVIPRITVKVIFTSKYVMPSRQLRSWRHKKDCR